jgi:hypothetical protein
MKEIELPSDFIYEFRCDEKLIDNYLEEIKKADIDWKVISHRENFDSSINDLASHGYSFPKNKNLEIWLSKCVNQVSSKYFKDVNLKICDMWLTKSKFGQKSKTHLHSCSFFSGLLYFQNCKSSTEFVIPNTFYNKYRELFTGVISEDIKEKTISITPEKGKLIIWPSYIPHKISLHKQEFTRYTLAFNTFIDGSISNMSTMKLSLSVSDP